MQKFLFLLFFSFTICGYSATASPLKGQVKSNFLGEEVRQLGKNLDAIFQDHQGYYWICSNGEGVFRYDGKNLIRFTQRDGLCSDHVYGVQEDVNHYLWFSTPQGVCRFNGIIFEDFTSVIQAAPIGQLIKAREGLFFNHFNGICFYDGKTFTNIVIHPPGYAPPRGDLNRPYSMYSFLVDRNGESWFGTQSEGVCRYGLDSCFYLTDKKLRGPAVRAMYQDKHGIYWFGNNGGGLFRYDGITLRNVTDEQGLGNPEFFKGKFVEDPHSLARIFALNGDKDGNLWIGTIDAGLWKYNGENLVQWGQKEGVPGLVINCIYRDRSDRILIICNMETICVLKDGRFERLNS